MIQRPRLLLIDDDPDYRRLLTVGLRKHFFVIEATNGGEGYSRALSAPPHIILLDVQMDGTGGLEALKMIRSTPKTMGLPVIMLTSDRNRGTVMEAVKFGATDYILKSDCNVPELVTRLMHLLPSSLLNA